MSFKVDNMLTYEAPMPGLPNSKHSVDEKSTQNAEKNIGPRVERVEQFKLLGVYTHHLTPGRKEKEATMQTINMQFIFYDSGKVFFK